MKEKNLKILYIIGLAISIAVIPILMIFGVFSLNLTSIIFFYAVKFLSEYKNNYYKAKR